MINLTTADKITSSLVIAISYCIDCKQVYQAKVFLSRNLHVKYIFHARYVFNMLGDFILSMAKPKYDFGNAVVTTLD